MSRESSHHHDRQIQDLISKGKFNQAGEMIEQKFTLNPEDPDGYYLRGVMFYFQGQVGKAVENLRRALSLDSRHTDAAICLSVLFNDIGRYDDAKKVFEQANQSVAHQFTGGIDSEIDKKFAVKHLELADLYFRYRRYDEAIEEYSKASSLDPQTLDIRIRRAKAYAKKGFMTRAIQELQTLKSEFATYIPARLQLGLLHYSQGSFLDAELEWEAILNLEPQHREALAYIDMLKRGNRPPQI